MRKTFRFIGEESPHAAHEAVEGSPLSYASSPHLSFKPQLSTARELARTYLSGDWRKGRDSSRLSSPKSPLRHPQLVIQREGDDKKSKAVIEEADEEQEEERPRLNNHEAMAFCERRKSKRFSTKSRTVLHNHCIITESLYPHMSKDLNKINEVLHLNLRHISTKKSVKEQTNEKLEKEPASSEANPECSRCRELSKSHSHRKRQSAMKPIDPEKIDLGRTIPALSVGAESS